MAHDLHDFFYPRTVALVGATDKPTKPGTAILENLSHFKGAVYPVNPKRATVLGHRCYPSLAAIPESIDLAIVALPARLVEQELDAHESIVVLNEMVDPPLNTVVWISNVTTGLPKNVRSTVASAYLAYLAGAGLSAAMLDVNDAELMKVVYLIKAFRDEVTFAAGDLA